MEWLGCGFLPPRDLWGLERVCQQPQGPIACDRGVPVCVGICPVCVRGVGAGAVS